MGGIAIVDEEPWPFKEPEAEARRNWLRSNTVIVLHDTRRVQPAVPRLPAFDPNHVLFSAVPPRWLPLPEFRALYGTDFERLEESVYEIFFRKSAERASDAAKLLSETPEPSPTRPER